MESILDLEERIKKLQRLDEDFSNIFSHIFDVDCSTGTMKIPVSFESKLCNYFGKTDQQGDLIEDKAKIFARIKNQKIVKIFNKWTRQGALFNSLRTSRPGIQEKDYQETENRLKVLIKESKKNCDFCQPSLYTPEDIFGRIKGKHSITAANVAKYDAWSSLVIFNNHDPLQFNLEEFSDYLNTGYNWFRKVYREDRRYKFPLFVWNCLYKAGASQVHGHAQILITKDIPYARVENLKNAIYEYKNRVGRDFFEDWFQIHSSLGLAYSFENLKLVATLTPTKEKEIIIFSDESPVENTSLEKTIYKTLRCFIDVLGVHSFNLSISWPSLDQKDNMPFLINLVDRGSLLRPTVDMGGMELFGTTVVSDDPYKILKTIREYLELDL